MHRSEFQKSADKKIVKHFRIFAVLFSKLIYVLFAIVVQNSQILIIFRNFRLSLHKTISEFFREKFKNRNVLDPQIS